MKKYFYSLAVIFVSIFILTACNNMADNKEKMPDNNVAGEQEDKDKQNDREVGKQENQEQEIMKADYPPTVIINGMPYQSMGYVNSAVTCGTADGKITSSVDSSKLPEKDNESNFGEGYEYQLWDKAHVNVNINGKWIVFQNLAISAWQIPSCVANFKAKVIEVSDDRLLVSMVDIPDDFKWIFQNEKIEDIKPISLSVENLMLDNNNKEVDIKNMTNKTVRVWFDGSVKNTEPEMSNPIELGEIYRIIQEN